MSILIGLSCLYINVFIYMGGFFFVCLFVCVVLVISGCFFFFSIGFILHISISFSLPLLITIFS